MKHEVHEMCNDFVNELEQKYLDEIFEEDGDYLNKKFTNEMYRLYSLKEDVDHEEVWIFYQRFNNGESLSDDKNI